MSTTYDAVIVGGRCGGAALASYLARDGASVAVLDANALGSDQVLSTHTIHPPGMDILDELGVGDEVRAVSPPAQRLRLQIDDAQIDVVPPPGRHECCPRRYRLDRLLQEAATAAGAEFTDRTRVTEVIREGERVVGVRAQRAGRHLEYRGERIVGADGRHSTLAELVGAEEYLGYDWPRVAYWAYWEPPAVWNTDEHPYDFLLRFIDEHRHLIFGTDHGQILIGTMPTRETAKDWPRDHEASYLRHLRSDPVIRPLVDGGTMKSPVVGTVRERMFYRRAAGPGWALVGDAGHHKDPLIGWGIAEALVQAKQLAAAIRTGRDTEVERYWRQRDFDTLPRFRMAEFRGLPAPINPVVSNAMSYVAKIPGLSQQMFRETEYESNPFELLPIGKVILWTLASAVRGRPRLLADFLRQGKLAQRVERELAELRKRLEAMPSDS